MKEAILYQKLPENKVRCNVCQVFCTIKPNQRGFCDTRINVDGKLYTLIFGLVSSVCVDPIEKKPLYHFYPASLCLSVGSRGCNFKCPGCQNWEISHDRPAEDGRNLERLSPEKSIEVAIKYNCQGISWTYNEPSIWLEYTLDSAKLAKKAGLYTVYVTNGYASVEGLDAIGPYLDAYRVDIKAFSHQAYKKISGIGKFEGILEVAKRAKKKWNMHVECVTNLTPTINDDKSTIKDISRWIKTDLGEYTPWHITRFYPHLELSHIPPTPIKNIKKAREIALEEGLKYVYVGNIPGHAAENTFCHSCARAIIKRNGYSITKIDIKNGRCIYCDSEIPGVWKF